MEEDQQGLSGGRQVPRILAPTCWKQHFVGLSSYGRGSTGAFWWKTGLVGFLANPPLSTNLVCLYQHRLRWASHTLNLSVVSWREWFPILSREWHWIDTCF